MADSKHDSDFHDRVNERFQDNYVRNSAKLCSESNRPEKLKILKKHIYWLPLRPMLLKARSMTQAGPVAFS